MFLRNGIELPDGSSRHDLHNSCHPTKSEAGLGIMIPTAECLLGSHEQRRHPNPDS